MTLLLGCIADDFTGATDLANTLVKSGLRTVQLIGIPEADMEVPNAEALVIALKSRSIPASDAVEASVGALKWLKNQGARQFFFKYCSTFDSTVDGNIGPVIDSLLETLGEDFTISCPAFPDTKRTVYQGHLFVNEKLLSDSSLRNHPLNPMTDSNLTRFLSLQTSNTVGLLAYPYVRKGRDHIATEINSLKSAGVNIAIIDALTNKHLMEIGAACQGMKLITGGSGVALGLANNFSVGAGIKLSKFANKVPSVSGPEAVISGSCSQMTLAQVAFMSRTHPFFQIDALDIADGRFFASDVVKWAIPHINKNQPFLISASASPDRVLEAQKRLGINEAGKLIEDTLADILYKLTKKGLRRLVVAGGETSGAVVKALSIKGLLIGPEIESGVPCTVTLCDNPMALTLKSGNFGGEDFFLKALEEMP
jgi:uncharacterized protein YgbK (DUF1537 family)